MLHINLSNPYSSCLKLPHVPFLKSVIYVFELHWCWKNQNVLCRINVYEFDHYGSWLSNFGTLLVLIPSSASLFIIVLLI